jgi:hypothetical protein
VKRLPSSEEQRQPSRRSRGSELSGLLTSNVRDLQSLAAIGEVAAALKTPEHDEERAARIQREAADAKVERVKGMFTFVLLHLLVVAALAVCFWIILSNGFSEDVKGKAFQIVTIIVTAVVGFVAGQKFGK